MSIFTKAQLFGYSASNKVAFTTSTISARVSIDPNNVPSRNFRYWTKAIIDGVIDDDFYTSTIYSPSAGDYNNILARGYFQPKNKKLKIRVWEEDPSTNPDAYVDSNEIDIEGMLVLLDSPKPEIYVDFEKIDGDATKTKLTVNQITSINEKFWKITNVKIYSETPEYTFYDGVLTSERSDFEIPTPPNGTTFENIFVETTLLDIEGSTTSKVKTIASIYPRFYYEGEESKITDFRPLMTSKGNRVTKIPFVDEQNGNIDFNKMKSAISGLNFDETFKMHTFESRNGDAQIEYKNIRTDDYLGNADISVYANSEPALDSSYIRFNGDLNAQNYDIKTGDKVQVKLSYGDSEIFKDQLTAQLCVVSTKTPADFKLKSLPPAYFGDDAYVAELSDYDGEEYVFFGEINSGSQQVIKLENQKITTSLKTDRFYPEDGLFRIYYPLIWHPNKNTITAYYDPNIGSEISIRPIYTSKKEKIVVSTNKTPSFGESLMLESKLEDFISTPYVNTQYKWYKNGVVLPGQISSYIEFEAVTPDDNGKYKLEYSVEPSGIKAADSALVVISDEFEINVSSSNQLSMTFDATDLNLEIDDPLEVKGTITIPTNTISKSVLTKNGVTVETFENDNLTPTYTVAKATVDDAGVYNFVITYTDGGVVRTFTSEPKHVTVGTNTPIDFSVSVSVKPVDEFGQATFVGKVNITGAPDNITYKYQWHKATTGAIIGQNDIDLIIDNVEQSDAGEYWLSVLAEAPNHSATVKASPHVELIVRREPQLKFSISAEKTTVADGKPAKLELMFSAAGDVNPTWDWYANGEIIPNSKDKPVIEHIGFGDVIYYVAGRAQNPNFIPTNSQSNIIVVKGVIAVENLNLAIVGPTEASLGERVEFKAVLTEKTHEDNSNPLSTDNYTFEWYRGSSKIGSSSDIRVYAATDAAGEYTYKVYSKVDPSISSTSPVHKFKIKEETPVSVTLPPTKSVKVGERLEIIPTITPAEDVDTKFQWMKNGNIISGATTKNFVIESSTKSDSGIYTLSVTTQSTPTISTPCVVTVKDDVTPPDPVPVEGDWYIHDLNPGRNRGFTWIGWWVLDEIQTALNDGFDWIADPENERFKYQNVLKALADNKDTWEDIELQESRNGYILLLSDLS